MNRDTLPRLDAELEDMEYGDEKLALFPPEIRSLALDAILLATYLDDARVQLFQKLLNADFRVASKVLAEIQSAGGRLNAIKSAAAILTPGDRKLVGQVLGKTAEVDGVRNVLCHYLWTHSPSMPDTLLLVHPSHAAAERASAEEIRAVFMRRTVLRHGPLAMDDVRADQVLALRVEHLTEVASDARAAIKLVSLLIDYLARGRDSKPALDELTRLLAPNGSARASERRRGRS